MEVTEKSITDLHNQNLRIHECKSIRAVRAQAENPTSNRKYFKVAIQTYFQCICRVAQSV
jgi:hypothetical protein